MAMNPLQHPGARQKPILDIEKRAELGDASVDVPPYEDEQSSGRNQHRAGPSQNGTAKGRLKKWNAKIEGLAGLEARGISRVLPEEKHSGGAAGYIQMFALWFGMEISVINLVLGFLGPQVFALGWVDCVCITIFANALAATGPAYTATFGPRSGLRTMVLGRYFMGYWPAKLACLLNVIMQAGWGIIGCIIAGQMISAVNGGGLTIAVGCVIAALCIGVLTTFGIAILHIYERYAGYPQVFAVFVLIGASGRQWNTSLESIGDAATVTANRCSFFALVFSGVIGFAAIASDFYVYYPPNTSRKLTFLATWSGLWTAVMFVELIGVGIATGIGSNPAWAEAYDISSGALLLACFDGFGGFGGLCVVILALGAIQNNAPSTYVAALSIQTFGRYAKAVPRWAWCIFIMLIQLACSVAGRYHLYGIFENFLPIMAYWVCPWLAIVIEEHLLFHVLINRKYDWTIWENKKKLPLGVAAMLAWLIGWAGAILGMAQVTSADPSTESARWYTGPIALRVGGWGGDIGEWLAVGFAGLTYPLLRYIEYSKLGR